MLSPSSSRGVGSLTCGASPEGTAGGTAVGGTVALAADLAAALSAIFSGEYLHPFVRVCSRSGPPNEHFGHDQCISLRSISCGGL